MPIVTERRDDVTLDAVEPLPSSAGTGPADAAADAVPEAVESPLTSMTKAYVGATQARRAEADWQAMERVLGEARGIPVAVGDALETGDVAAEEIMAGPPGR